MSDTPFPSTPSKPSNMMDGSSDRLPTRLPRFKQDQQLLWLTLLATIIWSVLMAWEAAGFQRQRSPGFVTDRGFSSPFANPIGVLTITRSAAVFQLLIDQCDPHDNRYLNVHVAQTNTCMDFLFSTLYGGVFLLFAGVLGGRLSRWLQISIVLTMAMDAGENIYLLLSLHAVAYPPAGLHPPGVFSTLKWALFAVSLGLLSALFAQARQFGRFWRFAIVSLLILSGTFVIAGLFYIPLLTLAVLMLGVALLIPLGLCFPIQPFSVRG